ncbi:hypothetical protein LINGRAHAP2_LOCUS29324 [Linum grandiflorum]
MDSPQSVVSPYKTAEQEEQKTDEYSGRNYLSVTKEAPTEATNGNLEDSIGVLQVYVHQARDIHNICIYHKQDVYAKIRLTSDPGHTVSTNTINGGGRNPVFNENLRMNVTTVDCSLKCEIFMMSRVKNYLEDQLLGFALVPLSELSFLYNGASPEAMPIPVLPIVGTMETQESFFQGELDKLEFPDPNVANENQIMVSEYFEIPSGDLESQTSEALVISDADNHITIRDKRSDSPVSSVSTNGVSSSSNGVSSNHSKTPKAPETVSGEQNSVRKDKETVDASNGQN